MSNRNFFLFLLGLLVVPGMALSQITEKQLKRFSGGKEIQSVSGPGLNSASGDIVITVEDDDELNIILVHNDNGKLSLIANNDGLLMGRGMLGNSGGSSSRLEGRFLYADYTIGSNSGLSNISMVFEKIGDSYFFSHYHSQTYNYGAENYFARTAITEKQTGVINFKDATEASILEKAGKQETDPFSSYSFIKKGFDKFSDWIPSGYELASYAEGDLNTDPYKKDAVLWLYSKDEDHCLIQLLLQQKSGTYKKSVSNKMLFDVDESFNPANTKIVVKNGFFTLEQRVGNGFDFDHRYFTFKYNTEVKNWLLHRYDVEHYVAFNAVAGKNVTHLTIKEFGLWDFEKLNFAPGDYFYDPGLAKITGTIIKKSFPDATDAVFVLKADYPVNALALPLGYNEKADEETDAPTIRGERELQVFSTGKFNSNNFMNKKVLIEGKIFRGQTRGQYTQLVLEIEEIRLQR